MIKAIVSIYAVGLLAISVGWLLAKQEYSFPIAMIVGVGLVSMGMVLGGALYATISNRSSDTTDISDIND